MTGDRRWLLGGLALLLVVFVAAVTAAMSGAGDRFEAHRRALAKDTAAFALRPRTRPPLESPTIEGNAFDRYPALLAELVGSSSLVGSTYPAPQSDAAWERFLGEHAASFLRLDEAARMACQAPPPPALGGAVTGSLEPLARTHAVSCLTAGRRIASAAGRRDEAAAFALREVLLGSDEARGLGFYDTLWGQGLALQGLRDLRGVLEAGAPTPPILERAARWLSTLDAAQPEAADVFEAEHLLGRRLGLDLWKGEGKLSEVESWDTGWRWFYDRRLYLSDRLDAQRGDGCQGRRDAARGAGTGAGRRPEPSARSVGAARERTWGVRAGRSIRFDSASRCAPSGP